MTDPEITALVREYAEDTSVYEYLQDNPKSTSAKKILDITVRDTAAVVRFLLRRYCLVEKSKVESVYNTTWNSWYHTLDVGTKGKNQCVLDVLHFLFPEFAKEVES